MSWRLAANWMWPRIKSTPTTPTSILLIKLVVVDEDEEEQDKVIVGKRKDVTSKYNWTKEVNEQLWQHKSCNIFILFPY